MQQVGLWLVTNNGPQRLTPTAIDLERQLEQWIERDPELLERGLTIVGRQVQLEAGPLDLLALDHQGRWVMIELKRDVIYRETIAQALDYASCVATLPYDQLAGAVNAYLARNDGEGHRTLESILTERTGGTGAQDGTREVKIFVVGTSRHPGLDRLVRYLADAYDMPISVVTYEVFEIGDGHRVLVRELTEGESRPHEQAARARVTLEDVCARANAAGIGAPFRRILETATRLGLAPRPYKMSVMYAPPSNRTRCLFTVWAETRNPEEFWTFVVPEAFAQFYPVTEQDVLQELGWRGYKRLPVSAVDDFLAGLERLAQRMKG